ncbi:cation:proton antiporter regulatory subunit [Actinoplanes sp. NPDC049668]|uniref:cation:proton antiporter regulatory subunit n=1 Tax=unclassified Actinoplanes TaxID=2626549 RepID=UPI0033A65437
MEIERSSLPGVGVSYSFVTRDGRRLGVICHPDGSRDLTLYDHDDPDSVGAATTLSTLEAHHLAEVLRSTAVIDLIPDGEQDPDQDTVTVARLPIPAGSGYDGRTLNSLGRQHSCVVAILRDGNPQLHPEQRWRLRHGDTLVTIGTRRAIDHLGRVLAGDTTTAV